MTGICSDRVVIITGAGGGLGRAHAKLFAAQGARVIVNDINGSAAQQVVDEIQLADGVALVNTDDITSYQGGENIVRQAIEKFGDVHVLVNNAGICRDRMFVSLEESDWDAVMAIHLKGHFCIASHACRYWREQSKQGKKIPARIINTSSGAGLQGSVGQANYSAAKGGIASLTLVQAAELQRYGITSNAIVPVARTSMTEGPFGEIMKAPSDGGFDHFSPDNVSPLVVWLGSEESSQVSGQVFEVEGGKIAIADGWRSGPALDKGERWQLGELNTAVEKLLAQAQAPQKVFGS